MTGTGTVRIGTRGSRLALAQARIAADALADAGIGPVEVVEVGTHGDAVSVRRPRGGWDAGDGQFTAELERALLEDRVDLAVHSYKDLPTRSAPGLTIAAVLERADPRDCLVSRHADGLAGLPYGARVGTSSPRRAAQLAAVRPDLLALPIRGNVETRLRRVLGGEYDAAVLAAAGLDRLGVDVPGEDRLGPDIMLPAPAQGALAIQARTGDGTLRERLATLDHRPTRISVEAERDLLRAVGGGCLAPLGALAEVDGNALRLRAAYEDRTGLFVRVDESGAAAEPEKVAELAAATILARVAVVT